MDYQSTVTRESNVLPGVRFTIRRMSFGRRLEFTKRVREMGHSLEFLQAGSTPADKLEAAVVTADINRLYLDWGLVEVQGLSIDSAPATAESTVNQGPEDFCQEVLAAIKLECGLTDEERKN